MEKDSFGQTTTTTAQKAGRAAKAATPAKGAERCEGSDGLSFDTTYSCSTAWGTRRTTTSPIADGAAWAEDCTCDYTCDAENEHTGATGGGFSFQPGPDG